MLRLTQRAMVTCSTALLVGALACLSACKGDAAPNTLAPTAEQLAVPKSKSAQALSFAVKKEGSKLVFSMDAPIEKITGNLKDATTGEVKLDLTDITKTTALITADLNALVLTQRKKASAGDAEYGEETKQDKQNEHARGWLEIDEQNPSHETHRRVQLTVTSVTTQTPDVTKLTGDERKVKATVSGEFLLHGRKAAKTVDVEVTFSFKDGAPTAIRVQSMKPFLVRLEEHDVKPRDAVGKLAATLLSSLSDKVAKDAEVSIDFTAGIDVSAAKPSPSNPSPSSSAKRY